MRVLIEFAAGVTDTKKKAESILRNNKIPFREVAHVFDSSDPDLMRFINVNLPGEPGSDQLSRALSALSAAPEVISCQPEPEIAAP